MKSMPAGKQDIGEADSQKFCLKNGTLTEKLLGI
jgi:hypothetical protein